MKTLLLLRHAKSSWKDADLADHDRPLNARGRSAAPRMGGWLRENGLQPDRVLCSTARRAVETWSRLAPELGSDVALLLEPALYMAEPLALVETVRAQGADATRLLVIGHNPGLEAAARMLAGTGPARDLARMADRFPTAALAVVTFDGSDWSAVAPGQGRLHRFIRPRDLDEA
jgi:phosphohistidine phosphatase